MTTTTADIIAGVDKLIVNMTRLDQITNGDATTTVTIDSGTVPSVAKFFSQVSNIQGLNYDTLAHMNADLVHTAWTMAWVASDATVANNGVYRKLGASGAGSWSRVADLPYSFIVATNAGAGTANAIVATTTVVVSPSILITLNITTTTTASPITVAFNGGSALTIKSVAGNDIATGGLTTGMVVAGFISGSTFRLVTDYASAASATAAAASAAAAAASAASIANQVVQQFLGDGTTTDFTLTVDPGSPNNMEVSVAGVDQLLTTSYSLVYVSTNPTLRFTSAPPAPTVGGVNNIQVRTGRTVSIGTPSDATVTPAKLSGVSTTNIPEGTNLYYTAARLWAQVLTGLSTATNAAIVATDSVLVAFGKLQAQVSANTTSIAGKVSATSPTISNPIITGTAAISNVNVATNLLTGATNNGVFVSGHDTFQICMAAGSGGSVLQHLNATGGGVPVALDMINAASTRSGYIAIGASTTSYATSSDYRLKSVNGTYGNSGSVIDAITIYDYVWKETGIDGVGAIAHELQTVFPHAVGGVKDEVDEAGNPVYQGVDYSKLVPVLIAEIKDLRKRVADLEK